VTGHELPASKIVLFPSLVGYGAQFNNHLYAPITPMPAGGYENVEAKVKALKPQLVRIFYNDNWDGNWNNGFPDWQLNYASFVKVVQLAQDAGATVVVSFQNLGNARSVPGPAMAKFADVLEDLVRNHGLTSVRWAEVGNEPNGADGGVTLDEYNVLYRTLHAQLVTRGLRDQIHLMGGGLVERSNRGTRSHYEWLKWIGANMNDVVDAYAEHVYWWYDKPGRLDYRLRDVFNLATKVLPPEQQKPMYLMEFGIRGLNTCPGLPDFNNRYYRGDGGCTDIWKTNVAAFQQLSFEIGAAQFGFAGTSKWDAYWAVYDRTSQNQQVHWLIGTAAEGYPLWPAYHAASLLFHTTSPGWQVIRVAPWGDDDWGIPAYDAAGGSSSNDELEQELAGYAGPNGELTIVGLDTHGKDLNTVSTEPPVPYSIGGLPANTAFHLALWNETGDGTNSIGADVVTNAAGVARFAVPLQAAFALTTVPVS
jgi:hypothetical protein